MYKFRKLNGGKHNNARAIGNTVMLPLAVTLFLMLNVILPGNVEARARGASGFGIYLTLVNPAHLRYDAFFHQEAPATFTPMPGAPSYVAEIVVSTSVGPSAIILPDGVQITAEKIRPHTPHRVVVSGRIFDHRVEDAPKMEKVYSLRIDNPPTSSSGISEVEIIVLYE